MQPRQIRTLRSAFAETRQTNRNFPKKRSQDIDLLSGNSIPCSVVGVFIHAAVVKMSKQFQIRVTFSGYRVVVDFVAQMATSLMCRVRLWSVIIGCKKSNTLSIFMLLNASMYNICWLCVGDSETHRRTPTYNISSK